MINLNMKLKNHNTNDGVIGDSSSTTNTKRVITHEDLWLMKRVGAPVPSPDGKWAIFTVTQPAYDKDATTDLWLVPLRPPDNDRNNNTNDNSGGKKRNNAAAAAAAAPRQLTHSLASKSGLDWHPNSTKVAFAMKRDDKDVSQIYIVDIRITGDGREGVERITNVVAGGVGARLPKFSPDGRYISFVSDVFVDDTTMNDEYNHRKYNARIYESFPIRYWDRWLNNDIQPHLFVQKAKVGAEARSLLANTKLVSLPGFGGLDAENGETLPSVWTLDSKSLVFVARTNKNMAICALTPGQLFCVDLVAGSEPIQLTNGTASYDEPVFRPDGKALLTKCEMGGDGKTYHHDRIMSFPWPFSFEKRIDLTAELDLSVVNFVVDSESKTIYFIAEAGEQTSLFSVSSSGGAVKAHNMPKHGCLTGLALGGNEFIACYESASCPPEVVRLNVLSGSYHAITHFHTAKVAPLDLPPIDRFTFISAKGRIIHNLLVMPAGFDLMRKYPLLVMIHGGPTPQFKDCWMVRQNYRLLASDCFVLLLTNYSGSSGYSEEFGQAIQFDPIITPADEINQGADEASKRYTFINGSLRGVLGASYGGHLANWMEATTTHYKAIISHAGLSSQVTQWATSDIIYAREMNMGGPVWENNVIWNDHSPTSRAGNHALGTGWVTPMLLTVGEHDFRVPINNTLEMFTYLQRLQVPSKLIIFPDANHHIIKGEDSRFWYNEVHSWLMKHLTNDKQLSML